MSKNKKIITSLVAIVMVLSTLLAIAIPASAATPSDGYVENVTTGKYVTIKNVGSGKLLNVYGNQNKNNANVTVYQADGTTGQSFQFVKSGDAYVIVPKCATSRALNVYGSSAKNNSNVCLWSKTGHSTQAWIIDYNPSLNGFVIRSANNQNYVLAATGSKNSSNVCLKKYNPNDKYQVWTSSALSATYNQPQNSASNSDIVSPVKNRKTTSPFQPYYRKDMSSSWAHSGIDYVSTSGDTTIYCFYNGKVTKTGYNDSVGYYVEIKHESNGSTFYSYYFHLKKNSTLVKAGDVVNAGTAIATMGNTGESAGAHLHFQITSASVINSNGSFHVLPRDNSKSGMSKTDQSKITSRKSSKGITFYNPEIVLTKGISVITG